ncbi:MAG: flippase-like domain-containing protein [Anaerolineales bacterium]|nr:flippase-like domain-containing protein [Anaerolineales bacterium]
MASKSWSTSLGRILKIGFVLLIFVLLGRFVILNWDEFKVVFTIGPKSFFLLSICLMASYFCASARFAIIHRVIGAPIGYLENFGLYMAAGIVNLVLPAQSGSVARAVYLKKRYDIPYSQAPSILLGALVITFFVGGLLMLINNALLWLTGQSPPEFLWVLSVLFSCSIFALWLRVPNHITASLGRIGNMLDLFFAGVERLRAHKPEFLIAGIWQVAEFVFSGLAFWLAFSSLGVIAFKPMAGINYAVFAALLNTVFITPGNIGVLETAIGYISQVYNFTFIQGVSATALVHGAGYLVHCVLAPISWYFLYHRKRKLEDTNV